VPVGPTYLEDGGRRVADPAGTLHEYPERG
jgi:hypothetical protein